MHASLPPEYFSLTHIGGEKNLSFFMLFFLGMFFVPESPRWLAKKGQRNRAVDVLSRINGAEGARLAITDIDATLANETGRIQFRELLQPKLRIPIERQSGQG